MAQSCEVCGRKPVTGNQITMRGKAKYLGGVGTKVTGISRRTFRPTCRRSISRRPTARIARRGFAPAAFAAAP